MLRGSLHEGQTWGLIVRGVHEGLVWGGFVRGSLNSTWLLKYHNKQSRQGHSCKAVLKRILDDFSYYDWELIKPEINISITSFLSPQVCPSWKTLTKNPQQLCCFYSETLTKAPQQVWQTLKNFDYPKKENDYKMLSYVVILFLTFNIQRIFV